jgi:ferredoxin-NADP reductase
LFVLLKFSLQTFVRVADILPSNRTGAILDNAQAGRPAFAQILGEVTARHEDEAALVFACGPGAMVNQVWDESSKLNSSERRVHFHHETFEF